MCVYMHVICNVLHVLCFHLGVYKKIASVGWKFNYFIQPLELKAVRDLMQMKH